MTEITVPSTKVDIFTYRGGTQVGSAKQKALRGWAFLSLGITFSCLFLVFSSTTLDILGFLVLTAVGLIISGLDLLHPYTWYVPLFNLYSISNAIVISTGKTIDIGSLHQSLLIQWVACVTFMLTVGPIVKETRRFTVTDIPDLSKIARPVYLVSFLLTIISTVHIWRSGIGSKMAIVLDGSVYNKFSAFYSLYLVSFGIILSFVLIKRKKLSVLFVLVTVLWLFISFSIDGDRTTLFKGLWVSLFLYHCLYKRISRKMLLIFTSGTLVLVPVLSALKDIAVTGKTNGTVNFSNIIASIANTEFASASSNLQVVLTHSNLWSTMWGKTIFWDLARAVVPSVLNRNYLDPTIWFNQTFFPQVYMYGGGMGFSLVAEGYINFGIIGVILWFLILGLWIRYYHKKSTGSIMWLMIYILSMPVFVFATRADFATILTQSLKQVVIPIFCLYFLRLMAERILRRR